ncbi:MAG: acyl-CoA dehydrogenase family protein [Aquisalinus sp.]|nr:acyl-CoA dehydrogenase family protein [Aquisalinus sp.]
MNFEFTEEQQMLRESLARFLREKYDFETRQKIIASDNGWSRDTWAQFAEMGLMAAAFPEEFDGFGGTAVDLSVIMEEFGRGLVVEPYLPTVVLAGGVLRHTGGELAKDLIAQISAGDLVMGLGFAEPQGRYDLFHVETKAEKQGDEYVLSGRKAVVLAANIADKLIIAARTSGNIRDEDGISLFLIDKDTDGLTVEGYPTIDGLQAGDVILDKVKVPAASLVGEEGKAYPVLEAVIDKAIIALAAEAMGVCQKICDLTGEYTRSREQFGTPIAQFQVLQHRMVDMFIFKEEMTSMTYMAVMKADTEGHDTRVAASMAKVQLGKSCKFIGESAVQLHGGMGITEEMAVGHYFMHATMMDTLFGNGDFHQKRYERLTGLRAA